MRWLASVAVVVLTAGALRAEKPGAPAKKPAVPNNTAFAVVFDFAGGAAGKSVADRVRLRLRRHAEFDVVDRLTTQEASGALADKTDAKVIRGLLKRLACEVAVYGTAEKTGKTLRVRACVVDLRGGADRAAWQKDFMAWFKRA